MDWDKLRVFHAVAEAGSFTHAGETLNLSQSAVSRQISGLEERLRVPLFHRHARGLILTEQGEILYRTTREIFRKSPSPCWWTITSWTCRCARPMWRSAWRRRASRT